MRNEFNNAGGFWRKKEANHVTGTSFLLRYAAALCSSAPEKIELAQRLMKDCVKLSWRVKKKLLVFAARLTKENAALSLLEIPTDTR